MRALRPGVLYVIAVSVVLFLAAIAGTPLLLERRLELGGTASHRGVQGEGHSLETGEDGARANRTWYFAEGSTRAHFNEYLCLFNPAAEPAEARVTYMMDNAHNIEGVYSLSPSSRTTVCVNTQVPGENDFALGVESDLPIYAERSIYFSYGGAWNGGHNVAGVNEPAKRWCFAEGCTRSGFDTYLCVLNPNPEDVKVDIDYLCGDGTTVEKDGVLVEAESRYTIAVHDDILGVGRHEDERGDVSIVVESPAPVVAERAVYFCYRPFLSGGHAAFGAEGPRERSYFAEGCTRAGFDTYLCVMNPGDKEALVDITYRCGDGSVEMTEGFRVPKQSRGTVAVHEEGAGIGRREGEAGDVAVEVESVNGEPVLVERPIYYSYRPFWTGGSDRVGCPEPLTEWFFAEGCTRHGFDTYICIGNFSDDDAVVDINYYCGDGNRQSSNNVEVGGGSRLTVPVHGPYPGIGRHDNEHGDVSTAVSSVNGVPVVAEQAIFAAQRWRTMDREALAAAWGLGERFSGNPDRNMVALTFDLETSESTSSAILDILKREGAYGTMFTVGTFPQHYPDLVARMAADGHEIGNHSMTHPMFTGLPPGQQSWELASTDSAVSSITRMSTKPYFRFPYGDRNAAAISLVNSCGYMSINWSVDPQDWGTGVAPDVLRDRVLAEAGPGSIILFHDKQVTVAALQGIISGLRAKGLIPTTLSDTLYPGP
jgi:peptidoglycan/xylan/chitin deacetylase (PgdA/CDA1 family)